MSRILIAWELGGNYGHLTRCLNIAKALRERGHAVMFAVRNTQTAAELLGKSGFLFVQAPRWKIVPGLAMPPISFSEILLQTGFSTPLVLVRLLQAWHCIFRLFRPDVVLADHAPGALLAAKSVGCPALAIGNAFSIPDSVSPQPSIRPWEAFPVQRLIDADTMLNRNIAAAWSGLRFSAKPTPVLTDLYSYALLDIFPEFDHGGFRPSGNYIGPIHAGNVPDRAAWKGLKDRKVLAYLDQRMPGFNEAMIALARVNSEVIAIVPGLSASQADQMSTPTMQVHRHLMDLESLLHEAALLVSYGGTATMSASLLAGVPMLLLPHVVEQWLTVERVNQIGASLSLGCDRSVQAIEGCIDQLLETSSYREMAQQFSRKYQSHDVASSVMRVVTALESPQNVVMCAA